MFEHNSCTTVAESAARKVAATLDATTCPDQSAIASISHRDAAVPVMQSLCAVMPKPRLFQMSAVIQDLYEGPIRAELRLARIATKLSVPFSRKNGVFPHDIEAEIRRIGTPMARIALVLCGFSGLPWAS